MAKRILLISDIHGNYPALQAIDRELDCSSFDHIINCGDSLVYAPFPNNTLQWLRARQTLSILGNTDKKVIKLLNGHSFKKPRKAEKRVMYTSTADTLTRRNSQFLLSLPKSATLPLNLSELSGKKKTVKIGVFHGSPIHHHEFIFADTPNERFHKLAQATDCDVIVTGHSHSPYYKRVSDIHFINPGSVGRMFDGDPRASCATLEIGTTTVQVNHHRIAYSVERVVAKIHEDGLPEIYSAMFRLGRKMN